MSLDDLARDLASGAISRRTALRRLAAGALGIGLAATPSALAEELERGRCPKRRRCGRKCCPKGARCKNGKCKCKGGRVKCGRNCCALGEVCDGGECVPGLEGCADRVCGEAPNGDQCGSCGSGLICTPEGQCVGCLAPSDCPGADTECQTRTCVAGVCGTDFVAFGTVTAIQIPGDCQQNVCDGQGNISSVNDDTDVPEDGVACTTDTCVGGVPVHTPNHSVCEDGLTCTQNYCDSASGCQSIPADDGTACTDNGGSFCSGGTCVGACDGPGDCPSQASDCKTFTGCVEGVCSYTDDPSIGAQCTAGIGGCQRTGVIVCNGQGSTVCNAVEGTPRLETCNGIDDDCDGLVDEDFPDLGDACACSPGMTGVKVCRADGLGTECLCTG